MSEHEVQVDLKSFAEAPYQEQEIVEPPGRIKTLIVDKDGTLLKSMPGFASVFL